jgi:pimeloyl-ACP methyl ester carboxylesterase
MLPDITSGSNITTVFLLPFLGGSQSEWTEVVEKLSPDFRCVTSDLPGFGAASNITGYSVDEMADRVLETLDGMAPESYVLFGHSMSGKVLAAVARRLVDGRADLHAPLGMVLVSPSPPGPEPMPEAKRSEMLAMFGHSTRESDTPNAEQFIRDNISVTLPEAKLQRTVQGVLEMHREAWFAWLNHGSKEDLSEQIGAIDLPVLIVAGKQDSALGPTAQRFKTMPHFPHAELLEFNCGHLAPLELPDELAAAIRGFVSSLTA